MTSPKPCLSSVKLPESKPMLILGIIIGIVVTVVVGIAVLVYGVSKMHFW